MDLEMATEIYRELQTMNGHLARIASALERFAIVDGVGYVVPPPDEEEPPDVDTADQAERCPNCDSPSHTMCLDF